MINACIGGFHLEAFGAAWGLMAPCGYCAQSQADYTPYLILNPGQLRPYLTFVQTIKFRKNEVSKIEISGLKNHLSDLEQRVKCSKEGHRI